MLGRVKTERPYYVCPACHQGQSPRDQELDVEGTEYSPGVRRMMAVVGSETSFDQGREQLELLAGLAVTTKAVERHAEALGAEIAALEQAARQRGLQRNLPQAGGGEIPVLYVEMDGTGVPVVKAETVGRAGKQTAQARTREVKLGCVFTQTTLDARGRPQREEGSTTYTGGIETAEAFGRRICCEAYQRGWNRARKQVVIGDGAPWIWNLTAEHFPAAIQIVDLYHARQHLWELAGQLWPRDEPRRRKWTRRQEKKVEGGRIESLLRSLLPRHSGGGRTPAPRRRLFCRQRASHALPGVSATASVCGLGGRRGGLQDPRRQSPEALGHVLEGPIRQFHHRPSLPSPEW